MVIKNILLIIIIIIFFLGERSFKKQKKPWICVCVLERTMALCTLVASLLYARFKGACYLESFYPDR